MNSITDPRVAEAEGGGYAPEQHEGTLRDGRVFYFRMRQNNAQLYVAPPGGDPLEADHTRRPAWTQPSASAHGIYPDSEWIGSFGDDDKTRQQIFTQLLDEIDAAPTGGTE